MSYHTYDKHNVSQFSPNLKSIAWSENTTYPNKYSAYGAQPNILKVLRISNDTSALYHCTVAVNSSTAFTLF